MAGRFEGMSDLEWRLFEDIFPPAPPKRGRGMPHVPFRKIVNTLLYILITGCRWCDVPCGPQWASKSATHRWLQRWHGDGTLAAMHARILGIAEERVARHLGRVEIRLPRMDAQAQRLRRARMEDAVCRRPARGRPCQVDLGSGHRSRGKICGSGRGSRLRTACRPIARGGIEVQNSVSSHGVRKTNRCGNIVRVSSDAGHRAAGDVGTDGRKRQRRRPPRGFAG